MPRYLALFRGINVSGKNIIKMQDLKSLMQGAGYSNVKTYIQSGNVVFEAATNQGTTLARALEALVEKQYGYSLTIFITDEAAVEAAVTGNPFVQDREPEPPGAKKIYVTFLSEKPLAENFEKLQQAPIGDDEIYLDGNILYFRLSVSAADSKLSNNLIENKLKVRATTRNWNTTLKLLEMLKTG